MHLDNPSSYFNGIASVSSSPNQFFKNTNKITSSETFVVIRKLSRGTVFPLTYAESILLDSKILQGSS